MTTTTPTTLPPVLLQRFYQSHGLSAPYLIAIICLVGLFGFFGGYLFGRVRELIR